LSLVLACLQTTYLFTTFFNINASFVTLDHYSTYTIVTRSSAPNFSGVDIYRFLSTISLPLLIGISTTTSLPHLSKSKGCTRKTLLHPIIIHYRPKFQALTLLILNVMVIAWSLEGILSFIV
jgi:hypothetical protein